MQYMYFLAWLNFSGGDRGEVNLPGSIGFRFFMKLKNFLPSASAVEVIESVSSVYLSVFQHSHGWTVWRMDMNFGMGVHFYDILAKFDGQGDMSKVKVTRSENIISASVTWVFGAQSQSLVNHMHMIFTHAYAQILRTQA